MIRCTFLFAFCPPDSLAELCPLGGTSVRAPKTSNYWRNGFQWLRITKPAAVCVLAWFFPPWVRTYLFNLNTGEHVSAAQSLRPHSRSSGAELSHPCTSGELRTVLRRGHRCLVAQVKRRGDFSEHGATGTSCQKAQALMTTSEWNGEDSWLRCFLSLLVHGDDKFLRLIQHGALEGDVELGQHALRCLICRVWRGTAFLSCFSQGHGASISKFGSLGLSSSVPNPGAKITHRPLRLGRQLACLKQTFGRPDPCGGLCVRR